MLQIRNSESGQKGGRKGKEGRTRRGDLREKHKNTKGKRTQIVTEISSKKHLSSITIVSFIGRKRGFEKREFSQRLFTQLLADRLASFRFSGFAGLSIT